MYMVQSFCDGNWETVPDGEFGNKRTAVKALLELGWRQARVVDDCGWVVKFVPLLKKGELRQLRAEARLRDDSQTVGLCDDLLADPEDDKAALWLKRDISEHYDSWR